MKGMCRSGATGGWEVRFNSTRDFWKEVGYGALVPLKIEYKWYGDEKNQI